MHRIRKGTFVKSRAFLLCLLISFAFGSRVLSGTNSFYEARAALCNECNGSGKLICSFCKGEDLTQKSCWNCKGEDLTQKACWNCKGEDLTQKPCWNCKGEDLTQKPCWNCKGSGLSRNVRCYYCSGTGRQPRCYYCSGT